MGERDERRQRLGMNPEVGQPQAGMSGLMVSQATTLTMAGGQMTTTVQAQQDPNQLPQIPLQVCLRFT
ncbi:hypothetical protein QYM36_010261 [Artemia franciscana]|uniref:Uncharacterized protein n=1 Tax=Artemia franciscana TaxID=6661 RepID=A0AA88HWT2_ARTSF|nr:hypothetical protein QYM36_010261 [Artemia franciscana]